MNGGCVLGPGDVVMTARGARQARVSVGDTVDARVTGATSPVQLKVTGIVSLPNLNSPYWWGDGPEDFPLGLSLGASGNPAATDPLIASPSTALNVPSQDVPTAIGQIPLRAGAVSLADEGDVERVLNSTTVELHVRAGEMLAVIGPSGSGKSTPLENVAFAQRGARRRRWPLRWSPEELIDPFDLGSVARRQVHHVSGGEQQRIASPVRWPPRHGCCWRTSRPRGWTTQGATRSSTTCAVPTS